MLHIVTTIKQPSNWVCHQDLLITLKGMKGRPKKPKAEVKSTYVRIRVTNAERLEIVRRWQATKAKTESEWIRDRLLGDE
jgi:hypothetical protein